MTVRELIELLSTLPADRTIVVQDNEGDAVLRVTGAWLPPTTPEYPGAELAPLQLTTEEA